MNWVDRKTGKSRRPFVIRQGKRLMPWVDAMIARSSRVPNDPVIDPDLFEWTHILRAMWPEIRCEALHVIRQIGTVPPLRNVSPDHRRIALDDRWRSYFLIGYGERIESNLEQCPITAAALASVPGLNTGFFSVLAPGTHIPRHRGVTKGLLTCHLGLSVPPHEGLRMELDRRTVRWRDGATLVFDDTWPHEVWNDTDEARIILLIQFERPLRQPGRAIARTFLSAIRRSAFVRDARANLQWDNVVRTLKRQAND
ncbi:aspartyl/asparaginyl beta-hydroxylase domain-containing protein [Rhizorhapis sp. SPR117]|uniref:aspartyl/asparaginyl beta-hydroxylase domain-containing protein n=1 Tax=Rhizorhapis sp. SPR117 TaxID=2912611 RepID=UPI001F2278E0|nr:aspartyl/asparaginyl beta-hydroxylase domain-containing protein [Rhizorhapis sp. SPR117]